MTKEEILLLAIIQLITSYNSTSEWMGIFSSILFIILITIYFFKKD